MSEFVNEHAEVDWSNPYSCECGHDYADHQPPLDAGCHECECKRFRGVPQRGLASAFGINTEVCEFCGGPLDGSNPVCRGLDGCAAHEGCLKGRL